MTDERREDLPEVPETSELDHLEELPELPDAPGLEPRPEAGGGTVAATPDGTSAATAGGTSAATAGGKRELEQAPLMLRKASLILLAGTLLPWLVSVRTDFIPWLPLLAAKAVALVAAWIVHQGYLATHGGRAVGIFARLGAPPPGEPEAQARGRREKLPFAVALSQGLRRNVVQLLGWGVAAAAIVVLAQLWPTYVLGGAGPVAASLQNPAGDMVVGFFPAVGEILTLLLASATYSHIFGYEHGGKFNPIFPLMFLGPGIAGLLGALGAFQNDLLGGLGCLVVAAGGMLACYVMFVAMKQAKIEGDRKRDAAREARKAQRSSTRRGAGA